MSLTFPFLPGVAFVSLVLNRRTSESAGAWRAGDVSSVTGSVEGAVSQLCCFMWHLMATSVTRRCCLAVVYWWRTPICELSHNLQFQKTLSRSWQNCSLCSLCLILFWYCGMFFFPVSGAHPLKSLFFLYIHCLIQFFFRKTDIWRNVFKMRQLFHGNTMKYSLVLLWEVMRRELRILMM